MSLYYEAAGILSQSSDSGSLKSRVYNDKTLKSKPAHLYALISETVKYQDIINEAIEKSGILAIEKKVHPVTLLQTQ
jgi:25S rRNA (cytosine2278-C5)-methyltransferase